MRTLKFSLFFFFATIFIGCEDDLVKEDLKASGKDEVFPSEVSFEKRDSALSFKSVNEFKSYMDNYETNKENISNLYEEGFVPYRPIGSLDENKYYSLVSKKQTILQKEDKSLYSKSKEKTNDDYDSENDDFITNDKFASILNAKGEVIIGDSIYRFTPYGRFSSLISKKEELDSYVKNIRDNYKAPQGTTYVTEDVQCFIPTREEFNKYEIVGEEDDNNKVYNSMYARSLPKNTDHYNNCHNSRDSWVERVFGISYVCEYKFSRKRKLRTIFSVENYGFYAEAYAQAKFKQKTWFGWFSSRDLEKSYLKINHAVLTFENNQVKVEKGDIDKISKYWNIASSWIENGGIQSILNLISTPDKGVTYYSASEEEKNRRFIDKALAIPRLAWEAADIRLNIDFDGLLSDKTHNIVILSAFDNRYAISNTEILKSAYQKLESEMRSFQEKPTGVFLVNHDPKNKKIASKSYAIFNEMHEASGAAVIRKYFKVPEKGTIENATISYTSDLSGKGGKFDWSFLLRYPSVKSLDISLESGAYYRGQWGGSKLNIVYND